MGIPPSIKSAILLSGGQDSLALAFWLKPVHAVTINYGQAAADSETNAAQLISKKLGIKHHILKLESPSIFSGSMFGKSNNGLNEKPEWTPFRNQFLVTIAAMYFADKNVKNLISGQVASDNDFSDGCPPFVDKINQLFDVQEGSFKLQCPAIYMTTSELIKKSNTPRTLLALAHSCVRRNTPCGECRGCYKHDATLRELDWY